MHSLTDSPPDALSRLKPLGRGLQRPECVLATADGSLWCADWRGGVMHIAPGGQQRLIGAAHPTATPLRPNGIARLPDASFLLAHLGNSDGGVYRLDPDGAAHPWLLQVDGIDLPPTNFVTTDHAGRTWITVSTRQQPRHRAWRSDVADGFIVCVDRRGARIVADGLGYTNEVAVHPDGQWLYVNETFARRLSRLRIRPDGDLGGYEVVCHFGHGTFPDGLAFDEHGDAWVVSIVSNRLIHVAADGRPTVWIEDADPARLAEVEAAYHAGHMQRQHLDEVVSQRLRNISSIAFYGTHRRTAVLGCLLGHELFTVELPVPGARPPHWSYHA